VDKRIPLTDDEDEARDVTDSGDVVEENSGADEDNAKSNANCEGLLYFVKGALATTSEVVLPRRWGYEENNRCAIVVPKKAPSTGS